MVHLAGRDGSGTDWDHAFWLESGHEISKRIGLGYDERHDWFVLAMLNRNHRGRLIPLSIHPVDGFGLPTTVLGRVTDDLQGLLDIGDPICHKIEDNNVDKVFCATPYTTSTKTSPRGPYISWSYKRLKDSGVFSPGHVWRGAAYNVGRMAFAHRKSPSASNRHFWGAFARSSIDATGEDRPQFWSYLVESFFDDAWGAPNFEMGEDYVKTVDVCCLDGVGGLAYYSLFSGFRV